MIRSDQIIQDFQICSFQQGSIGVKFKYERSIFSWRRLLWSNLEVGEA